MRSIRTKKVPGAPRIQSGHETRAKLLPLQAGLFAGSTARVGVDRKVNATECIDMGFSQKRPRQSDRCFGSFYGSGTEGSKLAYPKITFRDFQKLMVKRRRTVDDLVDIFRGNLDDNRNFFERVMSCPLAQPRHGPL
jgi:hypothetical protein